MENTGNSNYTELLLIFLRNLILFLNNQIFSKNKINSDQFIGIIDLIKQRGEDVRLSEKVDQVEFIAKHCCSLPKSDKINPVKLNELAMVLMYGIDPNINSLNLDEIEDLDFVDMFLKVNSN